MYIYIFFLFNPLNGMTFMCLNLCYIEYAFNYKFTNLFGCRSTYVYM